MDVSNFMSPLETVQVFSIFTYVNTLSDFLFAENFLSEIDKNKNIPVVNALYHYLQDDNRQHQPDLERKKLYLARKIINGTDLYGGKYNETLDPNFANTLINHIVDSLVFGRFSSVYGFIANTARYLKTNSLTSLLFRLKKNLSGLQFENEYGEDSALEPLAVYSIYKHLILPLFPPPEKYPIGINSTDYIYAQAGLMFVRSGQMSTESIAIPNQFMRRERNVDSEFQEYVQIAHTVEQLVLAKEVNETALKIFALPALINYFYNEKESLASEKTVRIINSPEHWTKAYKGLFSHLNEVFSKIENAHDNDYRYQFYLALTNIKNRTSLARETIENNCLPMTDRNLKRAVFKYMNNPESYSCNTKNGTATLEDLNLNFQYLVDNITQKYYNYEKESCLAAFGEDFKNSVDEEDVIISQGLKHHSFYGFIGLDTDSDQLIRPSDDLFQFYFPENETYRYFALVRKNYMVTLISEEENPTLFRERLGLNIYESFRQVYFPNILKEQTENFDKFLSKIAEKRSKEFGASLKKTNYDQTRTEWWKDFGLSLIPFYSCAKDIREKNLVEASVFCPMDILFFIPVFGEVGEIVEKMSMAATKSIMELSETTLRTMTLRMTLRTALKTSGNILMEEIDRFTKLLTMDMFKDLGLAVARFLDPGFELVFNIGRRGLGSIRALMAKVERKHLFSLNSVKSMLEKSQTAIANFPRKVGKMFGKDVYVNSVESGYGYRFLPLKDGDVAEIRTIYPSKEEQPLVALTSENQEKAYGRVNIETEEIIGKDFLYEDEGFIVSDEKTFELEVKSDEGDGLVEVGNNFIPMMKNIRPKKKTLDDALQLAQKQSKFSKLEIQNELKKYAFPETEQSEVNFVHEWINSVDQTVPTWAKEFKIEEPDVFFNLKYKEVMEFPELSVKDATLKIENLYPIEDYAKLRQELPVETVLNDFKTRKAYRSVTFEDYYALRYYGGSGYRKMAEDCKEATRMKSAIYRLAIRQSEDPVEQCVPKLFRGEARMTEAIRKEIYPGRKDYELMRFTSSSTDYKMADKYSELENPLFTKVIYEIKFDKAYVRSRVEHLFVLDEKETILLPGTKFRIDKVTEETRERHFGQQHFMKVELSHVGTPKSVDQKRIMQEIKKLKEADTCL